MIEYKFLTAKDSITEKDVGELDFLIKTLNPNSRDLTIGKAKELGVGDIELTSNPKRIEANILYKKLGFDLRKTNAYKMDLKP